MNILLYTTDYWYKEQLVTAFNNLPNKNLVKFDIANLVDAKMYNDQKNVTNFNVFIFDEDSLSLDFLIKVLLNCKDNSKNIIYLRTVKHSKPIIEHTKKRLMAIMKTFYPESIWVLQDIVELCNVINKLAIQKTTVTIKQNEYGFIDTDNTWDFQEFLKNEFPEYYQEGVCLLMQSKYILSILKDERSRIK